MATKKNLTLAALNPVKKPPKFGGSTTGGLGQVGMNVPGVTPSASPLALSAPPGTPDLADFGPGPGTVPLPPDPLYDREVGGLTAQHSNAIGDLKGNRVRTLIDFGYTEGSPGQIAFDPNNPYSRAALLQRRHDQAQTGLTNRYAAMGQLYAGSLQNAKNAENFQYGASSDALGKALINFLANNTSGQQTADTNYQLGLGAALGNRLGRLGSNPLLNPGG